MQPLEQILEEITAFENQLNRRAFIKATAFLLVVPPLVLGKEDRQFLERVSATLLPATALTVTGISVADNVNHLLNRGSADHRKKVLRFLAWSQRASILYGGDKVAINSRGSRFMLARKMGRTLSSLCLIAFWADERALKLIEAAGVAR
jgi:hypothetical protein